MLRQRSYRALNFHGEGQTDITKKYPNLYDDEMPVFVGCAIPENRENAIRAFERCCPGVVQIKGLRHKTATEKPVCQWEVDYQLKREQDLPAPGPALEQFLQDLMYFNPMDCVFITRKVGLLPNVATIIYGVKCSCVPLDSEFVMARPIQNFKELDSEALTSSLTFKPSKEKI